MGFNGTIRHFYLVFGLSFIQLIVHEVTSAVDCDDLSYYSKNFSKCLKYATEYNAICYESPQCTEWVKTKDGEKGDEKLQCINNRCICQEGYRWFQGKCQKYVGKGEECSDNIDCYDDMDPLALTCKSNKGKRTCECNSKFYDRGHDCRVKSGLFGDCAIESDCQPVEFLFVQLKSTCALGTCEGTHLNEGVEDYMEEYYKDVDVTPTVHQYLWNYILKDDKNRTSTNSCQKGVTNTKSDSECNQCYKTFWFKNTCICKPGFFLKNDICVAELGMQDFRSGYTKDKDCPIKPGKFQDNACYCKNYWFNDYTNRNCIKTTLQVTKSCMSDTWCKPMGPYSFCNTTTGQCQCNKVASFNETSFYCELAAGKNVTRECFKDTNCTINEECRDEKCACVDNFVRIEGTCLPEIGGSCEFQNCSHIPNSLCSSDKSCQCKDGYVSESSGSTRCLKVAEKLFSDCVVQSQCQNIPHAVCGPYESQNVTKQACICDSDFVSVNGTCYAYKTYGSTCSTRFNCTVVTNESLQCRNSICQCPVSKTYKDGYCSAALMTFDNHQIALAVVVLAWFLCKF